MGPGSDARWQCRTGNVVRVSLGDIVVRWSWVLDGQQDLAHSQAVVLWSVERHETASDTRKEDYEDCTRRVA